MCSWIILCLHTALGGHGPDTLPLRQLAPLEVVDARSAHPYKRYGIDRDGYCYSCNLAEIRLTDTAVWLYNVCDSQQKLSLRLVSVQQNGAQQVFRCREGVLVFEKMNDAPVFRLTLPAPPKLPAQLQLRSFYTDKIKLPRFAVHDCGDFEG